MASIHVHLLISKLSMVRTQTYCHPSVVPPDHVTLSESPSGPVRFGTTKSLTCSTDSANPAVQITWTRDGVTASDDVKAETSDGLYKAFTVTSTITIHTTRDHNQDVYKCRLRHMEQDVPGIAQSLPLNVTCK